MPLASRGPRDFVTGRRRGRGRWKRKQRMGGRKETTPAAHIPVANAHPNEPPKANAVRRCAGARRSRCLDLNELGECRCSPLAHIFRLPMHSHTPDVGRLARTHTGNQHHRRAHSPAPPSRMRTLARPRAASPVVGLFVPRSALPSGTLIFAPFLSTITEDQTNSWGVCIAWPKAKAQSAPSRTRRFVSFELTESGVFFCFPATEKVVGLFSPCRCTKYPRRANVT